MNIPGMDLLAIPLGWLIYGIYYLINNYFVTIFIFTLIVRALTFPFSLKSQKTQADRAKLAPRLERLQKKYKSDPKKLQEKQMALYEKEGISMTGGCLPMLIPMIVLFGVIAVIYSPLTYLVRIPDSVIEKSVVGITYPTENYVDLEGQPVDLSKMEADEKTAWLTKNYPTKMASDSTSLSNYYKELTLLQHLNDNEADILKEIGTLSAEQLDDKTPQEYLDRMKTLRNDFNFFGDTLLRIPQEGGFGGISILWLIPILSGLTAMASSLISMRFMKQGQGGDKQPGQGCSNVLMLAIMPLFSLWITFTVPGGVGVYWISSNIIAIGQTVLMNRIYNPAKIRAEAYAADAERRQQRREDKKRIAESRAREEEDMRRAAAEERERIAEKERQAGLPKSVAPSKNPNKQKRREAEDALPEYEDGAGNGDAAADAPDDAPSGPEQPEDTAKTEKDGAFPSLPEIPSIPSIGGDEGKTEDEEAGD